MIVELLNNVTMCQLRVQRNYSMLAWILVLSGNVICQSRTRFNPSIIQDSRLEPSSDGTFGFQYRTEDGISHAAQGDPTGFIQGSYSYKDPTGLKVNFNYFAGAQKSQKAPVQPQYQASSNPPQYTPEMNQQQYYSEPELYEEPQQYIPRTRPPTSYTTPQQQHMPGSRYTQSFS